MKIKSSTILILSCIIYGAIAGILVNCNGQFYASIAEGLGVSVGDITISSAVMGFFSLLSTSFVVKAYRKWNPKLVVSIAIICYAGSHMATGIINQLWEFYLISVIRGIFQGFLIFYLTSSLIKAWFSKNFSRALSVTAFSSGLIGIISNLILGYGIEVIGWRSTLMISCAVTIILTIPATCLWLYRSPEERMLQEGKLAGVRKDNNLSLVDNTENEKTNNKAVNKEKLSIGSKKVFILGLGMAIIWVLPYCFTHHLKIYAVSEGFSQMIGASLISISMAGNIIAKLLLTVFAGKVTVRNSALAVLVCILAGFALLIFPVSAWLLYAGSFLLGMSASVIPIVIPQTTALVYTKDKFDYVYAKYSTVLSMTSAVWISAIGIAYSMVKSYQPLIVGAIVLLVMSIIMLRFFLQHVEKE